nr:Uma2 family endonuclease [Chloroflexota bacterium]
TIEDLYNVPDDLNAEIISGEVSFMSPTGGEPGVAEDNIFISLVFYQLHAGRGIAVADGKGFAVDLPNRKSFSPDAAYHIGEVGPGFYVGAPIFAVEVRSENDYGAAAEQKIKAKINDYFNAGTQVVWDVDVLKEAAVRVHRCGNRDEPTNYHRGEIAEAEPALPGWSMPVDDIFDPTRKSLLR